MQHEVTNIQPLLGKNGRIIEEGWARHPLWTYNRAMVKGSAFRIKEWEYYAIINQDEQWATAVTFSDIGYAGMFAIAYIDLNTGRVSQTDAIAPLTLGKLRLPATSTEDHELSWANKHLRIALVKRGEERHIMYACPSLDLGDGVVGLDVDITLKQPSALESMTIATSWEKKRTCFYHNEKVNCLGAIGTIRRGTNQQRLPLGSTFGVLDWGRGKWTYKNTWYWASCSGLVEQVPFGLNLGYGFTDRSVASENVIIYDSVVHKLHEVMFEYSSYLEEWTMKDNEGRLDLVFKPITDRSSNFNLFLISSKQHQVFGSFSGTCILDNGQTIVVNNILGFAEEVANRW
jgi:hypothetical protein